MADITTHVITNNPQAIMVTGDWNTARTLVIMAVTKSTLRSRSSGQEITVSVKRTIAMMAPTTCPANKNNHPFVVVSTAVRNPSMLANP